MSIVWCVQIYLNLSQRVEITILSFKYVRALNFANIFIARDCPNIFFQRVFSNKQHKLLHVT
jgi:hypothetical protein